MRALGCCVGLAGCLAEKAGQVGVPGLQGEDELVQGNQLHYTPLDLDNPPPTHPLPSPIRRHLSTHVGADADHPELCERCAPVVRELGFVPPPTTPKVAEAVSTAP